MPGGISMTAIGAGTEPARTDGRIRDTRQRILREAEKLYYQGGYAGISLQKLAETVGITKPALFHHFRSKQDIFFAMLLQMIEQDQRVIQDAIATGDSVRARLRNVMMAMSQRPFFDPMKFMTDEVSQLDEEQRRQVEAAFAAAIQQPILNVIEEGMKAGALRPSHARLALLAFLNLMMLVPSPGNPVAPRLLRHVDQPTAIIDELLDIFLRGLEARKG